MTPENGENFGIWLTRIEGKMDLSNLRHDQTDAWKVTVDQRLHRHSNDISGLQASEHMRKGMGKLIHWVTGGSVVAVVAAILRYAGV